MTPLYLGNGVTTERWVHHCKEQTTVARQDATGLVYNAFINNYNIVTVIDSLKNDEDG